jgi:hypothetical protein
MYASLFTSDRSALLHWCSSRVLFLSTLLSCCAVELKGVYWRNRMILRRNNLKTRDALWYCLLIINWPCRRNGWRVRDCGSYARTYSAAFLFSVHYSLPFCYNRTMYLRLYRLNSKNYRELLRTPGLPEHRRARKVKCRRI